MTKDEKEFSKKINLDRANNIIKLSITVLLIDIIFSVIGSIDIFGRAINRVFAFLEIEYTAPIWVLNYRFSLVCDIISLFFLLLAKNSINNNNEKNVIIFIDFAIISICFTIISNILVELYSGFYKIIGYGILFLPLEVLNFLKYSSIEISFVGSLLLVRKYINKTNDPEKNKESTDWFYEREDPKEADNK